MINVFWNRTKNEQLWTVVFPVVHKISGIGGNFLVEEQSAKKNKCKPVTN